MGADKGNIQAQNRFIAGLYGLAAYARNLALSLAAYIRVSRIICNRARLFELAV